MTTSLLFFICKCFLTFSLTPVRRRYISAWIIWKSIKSQKHSSKQSPCHVKIIVWGNAPQEVGEDSTLSFSIIHKKKKKIPDAAPRVKRPVRPGHGLSGTRYLIPECCCTASSPCSPASSRTPTGTNSTGRLQSPMPDSSRLPHPGTAPKRRTPVRPASAVSAGSCAPTLPSR